MQILVDKAFVSFDKLSLENKLLVTTSLLPVFADMLEDVPMRQLAKSERNKLIAAIRAFDAFFMNGADAEEAEEQVNIQRWFREMLNEHLQTDEEI
jgi:hypothetical protein